MPTVVRVKRRITVIDNCEFRDKITIVRRSINDTATTDMRFTTTDTKICDCWAVWDGTGAGVPYFDRVANHDAGITDYFFVKKSVNGLDKRCVVVFNDKRYNVKSLTDLGMYWRLNCSVNGYKDKVGSTI